MRTSIYIHDKLYEEAKKLAADDHRTFSGLITKLLSDVLKKKAGQKVEEY